jgi:isopentenyl-diphosphate delta-isomerase
MDVILVDEKDRQVGVMEKMEVHQKALLHRAFSIFIFNDKGEMLLQKRAADKYHSGGLWTNACCSHPQPGQTTAEAAATRLKEEMGFAATLQKVFDFIYTASFDNGLTEYEFDHVFTGTYNGEIIPDKEEVSEYCYKPVSEIRELLQLQPQLYTEWFRIAFPKLEAYLAQSH